MAKKSPENASPVAQFEQSLESLEQLVEQMETGELSLEASQCLRTRCRSVPPVPAGAGAG